MHGVISLLSVGIFDQIMAEKLNLDNMTIDDEDSSTHFTTAQVRDINNKRSNYLDWDEYFMAMAFLAAMRSKDPVSQVGACIVNENKKIVGIGYNGMPKGCNDDDFPWKKEDDDESDTKFLYVCHAELNAILNKNASSVQNCILHVGLFPCHKCAQAIIQSGIKKVLYMSDRFSHKETTIAAKRMFDAAKVQYGQYEPAHKKIVIDFSEINWNAMVQLPSTLSENGNCDNKIESSSHSKSIDGETDENDISQSASQPLENNETDKNNKRLNYLDWDEYFMATAFLAAMRSKDPVTQVGACIVNEDEKIVSVGYNGMPLGCHDDDFPWKKDAGDRSDTKHLYVCHAELNAILNKNASNVKNCSLYVGLFPCNECAKAIIQSGIKKVLYMSDKHKHKTTTVAAKRMFDAAKVEYSQYKPRNSQIVIDFSEINWNDMTQLPPTPAKNKNL